jgi:hypothetical protein
MLNKELRDKIINDLGEYAKSQFEEYADTFLADIKKFLKKEGDTIEKWLNAYNQGMLSNEDFICLVRSKKDELELAALKKIGETVLTAEQMKNVIVELLANAALKYLGISINIL